MREFVTHWTGMMFYEDCMPTRRNHEQHDETRPIEAMTIQRYSESKFADFIFFVSPASISLKINISNSCHCR